MKIYPLMGMIFGIFGIILMSVSSMTAQTTKIQIDPYCHDDGATRTDVQKVTILKLGKQSTQTFYWWNPLTEVTITAPPTSELSAGTCNGGLVDSLTLDDGIYSRLDSLVKSATTVDISAVTYRIDGLQTGTSTASTGPASTPTIGNTVTITDTYKSISWVIVRQDTSDDPLPDVTINGLTYTGGTGEIYPISGRGISSTQYQQIITDYQFTATGDIAIDITVMQ